MPHSRGGRYGRRYRVTIFTRPLDRGLRQKQLRICKELTSNYSCVLQGRVYSLSGICEIFAEIKQAAQYSQELATFNNPRRFGRVVMMHVQPIRARRTRVQLWKVSFFFLSSNITAKDFAGQFPAIAVLSVQIVFWRKINNNNNFWIKDAGKSSIFGRNSRKWTRRNPVQAGQSDDMRR